MSHGAIGKPISLEWLEINQPNRCVELQRQAFRNFKTELWLKLIDGFSTFFLKIHNLINTLCRLIKSSICTFVKETCMNWFQTFAGIFSGFFYVKRRYTFGDLTADC